MQIILNIIVIISMIIYGPYLSINPSGLSSEVGVSQIISEVTLSAFDRLDFFDDEDDEDEYFLFDDGFFDSG